jgi:hypothetical protein
MYAFFKKRYIIPVVASIFLFVGVSFKEDFFEVAKQIEILPHFSKPSIQTMLTKPIQAN